MASAKDSERPSLADSKYADLSGISTSASDAGNPYKTLIAASSNDPKQIQARYENHRRTRNDIQRAKLLDPTFKGADIDPVLYKLLHKDQYPDFRDSRYCLVFWARPTAPVKQLVKQVQDKLREVLPNLWLMPPDNLHMTTMEIAHSRTDPEIEALVEKLSSHLKEITDYTYEHRTRLIRPLVGFDASAVALSFVPATESRADHGEAAYTYHHLRPDMHDRCLKAGVEVGSRYVVPSAHLTIGRFVTQADIDQGSGDPPHPDPEKMRALVTHIDEINRWLQENFWRPEVEKDGLGGDGSEWIVGQGKGLDCCKGTLWYGNGQRVRLGAGF